MRAPRRVKREFRQEISGELRALDNAIQELGATIRSAVRGIAEAALDAQDEFEEESEYGEEIAEWAESIPLSRVRRSRGARLEQVREIAPLLASTRKPDLLHDARSDAGIDDLPPEVTAPLALLICRAVFDALGVDPEHVVTVTRSSRKQRVAGAPSRSREQPPKEEPVRPAPQGAGDEEAWKLIEKARRAVAEAKETIATFDSSLQRSRNRLLAEAQTALGAAEDHYDGADYDAARASADTALAKARAAAADPPPERGSKTTAS